MLELDSVVVPVGEPAADAVETDVLVAVEVALRVAVGVDDNVLLDVLERD